MYKIVLFLFLSAVFFQNTFQAVQKEQKLNNVQFVCGKSKHISKCGCGQETNEFEHIPLFNIDCSRVDFTECPSDDILPLLMGKLDLSHNKIKQLDEKTQLSSETLLYLDFSYNKIKQISSGFFKNLTQLTTLNLKHNLITHVTQNLFYGLNNLKTLDLSFNKINHLPEGAFNYLPSLTDLSLRYNDLGEFLQNIKLSEYLPESNMALHLTHVNLKNISKLFDGLVHLTKLSLANNPIQELPHLHMTDLEFLDISGTNISHLSERNLMYPYLKVLKLNRLSHLTNITEYTFYNLHKLEVLEIEHCTRLEEFEPMAFGYLQDRNSSNAFTLKKFSVAYSGLKTLKDNFEFIFEYLDEVNLRGNRWHCDCKINWFRSLKNNLIHVNETRCSSPEDQENKIIKLLTDEELSCFVKRGFKSYTPLQQWLFPIVGVLSLIVIVLVGLLIYMGPYNTQSKSIGPESPYNHITIHPNQAENFDRLIRH